MRYELIQLADCEAIVIDDFYPHAEILKNNCPPIETFKKLPYDFYPGIRSNAPIEYLHFVKQTLNKLGALFAETTEVKILLSAYSLPTKKAKQLRPIQLIPHIDSHQTRQYAIVHYLCSACHGGTSFYQHRSSGLQRINTEAIQRYFKKLKVEVQENPPRNYVDGDSDIFQRIAQVECRFNRAVIYPGNLLHSGDIVEGRDTKVDTKQGRLTINTFFSFD